MDFWKDERGVAMTEGVIVVPFFIMIWMGLTALHHLWDGRLTAQVTGQGLTLQRSRDAECGDQSEDLTEREDTAAVTGSARDELAVGEGGRGLEALEAAGVSPFSWVHVRTAAQVTVAGVPQLFGGPTTEVGASSMALCNMEPVEGLTDLAAELVGWNP